MKKKIFLSIIISVSLLFLLVTGNAISRGKGADRMEELYDTAMKYYEEHTYHRARDYFEEIVKTYPDSEYAAEAEYMVAMCDFKLERYEDAVKSFQRVVKDFPDTEFMAKAYHQIGNIYFVWDRWNYYDDGIEAYQKAIDYYERRYIKSSELIQTYFDQAQTYMLRWDDREKALNNYRRILRLKPTKEQAAEVLFKMGEFYQQYGGDHETRMENSLKVWGRLLSTYPDSELADDAQCRIAQLYIQADKFLEAEKELENLLNNYPDSEWTKETQSALAVLRRRVLNLYIDRMFYPGQEIFVNLRARNISEVKLSLYKFDLMKFFRSTGDVLGVEKVDTSSLERLDSLSISTGDKKDHQWLMKEVELPITASGAYIIETSSEELTTKTLLIVSDIALVTKYDSDKLLAFVVNNQSGKPYAEAQVAVSHYISEEKREVYTEGYTDLDGLFEAKRKENERGYPITLAKYGDNYALSGSPYYRWWYGYYETEQAKIYIYTDRPVYRPEQTVYFKGILRIYQRGIYKPPQSREIQVRIRNSKGEYIYEKKLKTNEMGSFSGEIVLGEEPPLGFYSIEAQLDLGGGRGRFRVEEYKKPEYKVSLTPDQDLYHPGDRIEVELKAEYYFGGPVPNADVTYTVFRSKYYHPFWWSGEFDWFIEQAPPYQRYWDEEVVDQGKLKTDLEGLAVIAFYADKFDDDDYLYRVEAKVVDQSRREVIADTSAKVTRTAFYLYARAERFIYNPTDKVRINIRALTPNNKPVRTPVDIAVYLEKWNSKRKRYDEKKLFEDKAETDEKGKGTYEFYPDMQGYFRVKVTALDEREEMVEGSAYVWVAGEDYYGAFYDYTGVDIITDKDVYDKGDTAHILINSVYSDTSALFTIEADGLYYSRVIELKGNSASFEVPIKDEYSPNVYFSVAIVSSNQLATRQKDIIVPPTDKFLKVRIITDKETYGPQEIGKFTIETLNEKGEPVSAELSLGLVDASIYYIQEELADDIRKFFYGDKRYNRVITNSSFEFRYWSAVEGEAKEEANELGFAMLEEEIAPMAAAPMERGVKAKEGEEAFAVARIRAYFPDTAFWRAYIKTDESGRAEVEVRFPDTLTTWRATARAITLDTKVGWVTSEVITRKNVIIRLEAPRFFTQRDVVTLSAIVHNYLDEAKYCKVILDAQGLEMLEDSSKEITIEPNEEIRVDWKVKATSPGEVKITATALTDEESDAVQYTFPILPHGIEKAIVSTGKSEKVFTEKLEVPADRNKEADELKLILSPTIASALLEALPYLAGYPYGCVEQTMSRFLPDVIVARVLQELGQRNEDLEAKLPDMVEKGLKRLYDFQHSDGGWGWWKNGDSQYYMTAYVVYGLAQAQAADFAVSQDVLRRGVDFLKDGLKSIKELDTKAYAIYSLTEAGVKDIEEEIEYLFSERDELNDLTRAFLALSLHNLGRGADAQLLIRNMEGYATLTDNTAYWGGKERRYYRWSSDRVEATAYTLKAYLAIAPDHELVSKAVNWLVLNRRGSKWKSTKDTAAVIYALADHVRMTKELKANYVLEIYLNDNLYKIMEVTPENILDFPGTIIFPRNMIADGENTVRVEREGEGNFYYSIIFTYYTMEEDIPPSGYGLEIKREYFRLIPKLDRDNKLVYDRIPLEGEVRSGDEIEVKLTIKADNDYEYLVFEDPKPSGCEAVEDTRDEYYWWYSNKEVRDEKVVIFRTWLPAGEHTITHRLRAEIPGDFHVMPTLGYPMYLPEIRGTSAEYRLSIFE